MSGEADRLYGPSQNHCALCGLSWEHSRRFDSFVEFCAACSSKYCGAASTEILRRRSLAASRPAEFAVGSFVEWDDGSLRRVGKVNGSSSSSDLRAYTVREYRLDVGGVQCLIATERLRPWQPLVGEMCEGAWIDPKGIEKPEARRQVRERDFCSVRLLSVLWDEDRKGHDARNEAEETMRPGTWLIEGRWSGATAWHVILDYGPFPTRAEAASTASMLQVRREACEYRSRRYVDALAKPKKRRRRGKQ